MRLGRCADIGGSGQQRRKGGSSRGSLRDQASLPAAVFVTAIAAQQVAIIAELDRVEDDVAAVGQGAIGTAGGIGQIGIEGAAVTLLTQIGNVVAALTVEETAGRGAAVRQGGVVEGRFALFTQCTLDSGVAATALLEETV